MGKIALSIYCHSISSLIICFLYSSFIVIAQSGLGESKIFLASNFLYCVMDLIQLHLYLSILIVSRQIAVHSQKDATDNKCSYSTLPFTNLITGIEMDLKSFLRSIISKYT